MLSVMQERFQVLSPWIFKGIFLADGICSVGARCVCFRDMRSRKTTTRTLPHTTTLSITLLQITMSSKKEATLYVCWCVIELADLCWLVTGGHGVSQNRGSLRLCLSHCLTVIRWCVPGTLHQLSQFCNLRLISPLSLFISCPTVVGVHLFLRWPVWWGTNGTIEELPSRDNVGGAKTANMWKCEECGQKRQKSAAVQDRARKAKIRKAHQREPALEQWRSVQRLKWKMHKWWSTFGTRRW